MNRVVLLRTLQRSFRTEHNEEAHFRALGGRSVLITFHDSDARDALLKGPWMDRWFERAKPWQGEPKHL